MRLVIISDTHGQHPELPDGDVLVHCGDLTKTGTEKEVTEEMQWLSDVGRYLIRILVPGNHDHWFQFHRRPTISGSMWQVNILVDDWILLDGIKFYGTPWCPAFLGWGFGIERNSRCMKHARDSIPGDVDVLVTHSPPYGVMDQVNGRKEHLGCEMLARRVQQIKPKVHCFGHIHTGGYGQTEAQCEMNGTTYVNASVLDEQYNQVYPAQVVDL